MVLHGEGHRESRILKVTLTNRDNQLRNFTGPGRDYSIPVPSSIFYELSFFEIAAPKILSEKSFFMPAPSKVLSYRSMFERVPSSIFSEKNFFMSAPPNTVS